MTLSFLSPARRRRLYRLHMYNLSRLEVSISKYMGPRSCQVTSQSLRVYSYVLIDRHKDRPCKALNVWGPIYMICRQHPITKAQHDILDIYFCRLRINKHVKVTTTALPFVYVSKRNHPPRKRHTECDRRHKLPLLERIPNQSPLAHAAEYSRRRSSDVTMLPTSAHMGPICD